MPASTPDEIGILVVDNNREYCEELAVWLRGQDSRYRVDIATNELEVSGLLAEKGEYTVALVDQVLAPPADGLTVMRSIRKRYPNTAVIMYTGWGIMRQRESALTALREGVDAYLSKPTDPEELLLLITRAAERQSETQPSAGNLPDDAPLIRPSGAQNMNYQNGFGHLRQYLTQHSPEMLSALSTLEDRFHKNQRAERIFGDTRETQSEHAKIIYALNELALEHCGISFNDLCTGKQNRSGALRETVLAGTTAYGGPLFKSIAFQLGYHLAALDFFVSYQKRGIPLSPLLPNWTKEAQERCAVLASAIDLIAPKAPEQYFEALSEQVSAKPIVMKKCFHIGNIIGRAWFFGVNPMQSGLVPPDQMVLERLEQAEDLLGEAALPNSLLSELRQNWESAMAAAESGHYSAGDEADRKMGQIIEHIITSIESYDSSSSNEIIERLRRIEQKLDQGRAEDRQAAAQILDVIKAHEVSDTEVAQMVSELRAWTKTIEQTGLPLKPELQDALKALTEHSGSAYQYLQLALPIIPGILSYNVELGSQHQADLRAIWDRIKTRLKKQRPVALAANTTARVTVLLEGNIHDFTPSERDRFIVALARIADIPADQIRILQAVPGSILLTLELPESAAQRLVSMYLSGDAALQPLHIQRVELQPAKGQGAASTHVEPVLNSGKAWAVLVGINDYDDPHISDLKVCVADVTAIHQALDESYQVAKLLTDVTPDRLPTRANILGDLSAVAQSTQEGDLLLFYFSGHGVAEGGESYLLPRDARLSALKYTSVAMREVRELMDKSPARAKVIVLDACHSGASIGKASPVMTPEFIQRVFEEAEGIAVLASCKQGQQSWEWPAQGHSVFTHFLLEGLGGQADFDQKGFVTISDVGRYVTDGVKKWAAQQGVPQTPTLELRVAGDIILVRYVESS